MAYAAVISLKYTILYLKNPENTRSAIEDLDSLGNILQRLDGGRSRITNNHEINALDVEIREAAYKLEDALQSYYILCEGNEKGLQREIDSFSNTVKKLKVEYLRELDNPVLPVQEDDDDASSIHDVGGNRATMVGLWDQFEQIRNVLLDSQSGPKVVSLVGMAGIGKTHLATQIYHDPLIDEGFDYRVWLSVGSKQEVKNVWAEIVALVEGGRRNVYMETNIMTLVGILQRRLLGLGRCLIVLDDVWSSCDGLIRYLGGAEGDGRRVLVTTRLEEVARNHSTSIHYIRFFNSEESWKLLQQSVFGEQYVPPQLEAAGRTIADNCEGLPLLILAIADILRGLEITEEYWNEVADSKTTTFTEAYDRIEKVLFSSYEYLPQYLKACFLYMGVFPQKSEIPLPKLTNLWIVEDVLEPQASLIRTIKNKVTFLESAFMERMVSKTRSPTTAKTDAHVSPIQGLGGNKSTTVGLWDQFEQIRDEILDLQPEPKAVWLVGMAGIGKTHLATQIYHDSLIGEGFDFKVWFGVGPHKQAKNVLAEMVALVGEGRDVSMETNITTLLGILHMCLLGRGRCLIVLDDVWNSCDGLIRYLGGAERDGRRVLVTTRLEEVAWNLSTNIHNIRFFNSEESWKLLQQSVFGEQYFPPQLETAGRKIAENCEGLPRSILAIADILCGLEKTEELWNKIADSKTTTITDACDRIEKVLSSSFEYLPQHLKAWIVEDVLESQPSLTRTRKEVDLLDPSIGNVALLELEHNENRVARTSIIDSLITQHILRDLVKNALFEPRPSETRLARTSENDASMQLMLSETRYRNTAGYSSLKKLFRPQTRGIAMSRYMPMSPFESLYLLEPGSSPNRFLKPLGKKDLWKPKLHLTREGLPSANIKRNLPRLMGTSVLKVKTTPEGIATECLKKLVSNSLTIISKKSSNNKIKSCKLHSAYWHLCVKEAKKNKFFHVLKKLTHASRYEIESQRRLSVQNNMLFGIKEVYDSMAATLTARSLLCTGPYHEYPVPVYLNLMLLKVLDALAIRFYDFPTEVVNLLELRYLALTHNGEIPSSISMLQQLQYLIVRQHHNIKFMRVSTCLPQEIWYMKELVYLRIMGSNLPDPSKGAKLPNLSTLHVNSHSCTKAVFRGTPNLKKLRITIELQPGADETLNCFRHISLLERLHSLKCVLVNPQQRFQVFAPPNHFVSLSSLRKLSLNGMGYSWEYMWVIGSLPRLKVLKLRYSAFEGLVWITMAGGFQRLEFLLLADIDLVHWTTDDDDNSFPSLQCLIIQHCYKLKEIPSHIGLIPSLKRIEVVDCSPSLVASAEEMHEKGSSSLQVVINSSWNRR